MQTILIKRADVEKVLDMRACVESVETAFRLSGLKKVKMPPKAFLYFENFNGDLRTMSAYLPDLPIAGMKSVNVHPDNANKQLPTVMAIILLIDPATGMPLALIDGTYITNMRTGAAGGVASKYLANKEIEKAGFVGAGTQARYQLDAIMLVHPEIRQVAAYDINHDKLLGFLEYASSKYNVDAIGADELKDAVSGCGIVSTTTSSRRPLFDDSIVSPGTHINAIGADAEGKQELSASVLKKSVLVIDDWIEASHSGEINVPVHMGELTRNDINAELGEIITGQKIGRMSPSDITVFDSAGLALQDIVTAWNVYNRLTENEHIRKELQIIDFME